MKIHLTKHNNALHPFDDKAAAVLKKWKEGDYIEVEVKRPRNSQFHRKFFALLNIVFANTDHFENMEEVLTYFKIKGGIYKTIKVNGNFYPMVGSIAFSKMDEDEFALFYDKAIDTALQLIPMDREELALQVAKF